VSRLTIRLPSNALPAFAAAAMLLAAVFRLPVRPGELRVSFALLAEAAVGLTLALALWRYANRWVASFLVLALVSSFFPFYDRASFLAFHGIFYMALWYGLVIFVVAQTDRSALEGCGLFLNALCIAALFNVVFVVLQVLDVDPLFEPIGGGRSVPAGLMANPNEASALLAFAAPAFWRPRWRWGLVAVLAGLCMVKSVGGPLALGCGAVFYGVVRGRLYLSLGLALAGVLFYAFLIDAPGFERWPVWKQGLKLYTQHWVMGSGIGHWKYVFHSQENLARFGVHWSMAHNELLQGLFEMGIGFAVVLAGYLRNAWRRYHAGALVPATALVIILVNSLVNYSFHIAGTAMVAVTWLAILEIHLRSDLLSVGPGTIPIVNSRFKT